MAERRSIPMTHPHSRTAATEATVNKASPW